MKISNVKLSKILAVLGFAIVFAMIFINFGVGITSHGKGLAMEMQGAPSLFTLMFGGFEGLAATTFGGIQYLNPLPPLLVAFAFEIVATVLLLVCAVAALLNKNNGKIVGLINALAICFVLVCTIISFCTKVMVKNTMLQQLIDFDRQKDLIEAVKNNFNSSYSLGSAAVLNGVFGILAITSLVASRILIKKNNNVVVNQ